MPWSCHVVRLLEKCHGGGIPWSCHKKKSFFVQLTCEDIKY